MLQPLGKKKQDAALLATPLPRMTENAVVAQPASDAEKVELNKWIQERKASYPSAANLTAKQADADRCNGAHSWLFGHQTKIFVAAYVTYDTPASSWRVAAADRQLHMLVRQAGSHRAIGREGRAAAAAQGGGGAAACHGPRQGGAVPTMCCLLHERFKSVRWLPVRRITWDSMRLSSVLAVIAGGHHFHVWRGGEQWWWQLHFTRA